MDVDAIRQMNSLVHVSVQAALPLIVGLTILINSLIYYWIIGGFRVNSGKIIFPVKFHY